MHEKLQIKIDSLSNQVKAIEQNTNDDRLVQEYKDLVSLFSIGFGILIGLFGLVFPLIIYLVQIKPSIEISKETKQLIKRLEQDFENSFISHLKKNREKLIDNAIQNLAERNTPMLSSSVSLLENYKSEGFTEIQIVRLIKLLKQEKDDFREFIARLLTFQEDANTEEYFRELIEKNPEHRNCIWGALYFATYNKPQYMGHIARMVINGYSLTSMISSLLTVSSDFATALLNNQTLVNDLNDEEFMNYGNYGMEHFIDTTSQDVAQSTLFWKKYQERINDI